MSKLSLSIQRLLDKLPYIRGLRKEVDNYYGNACFKVGHYYNPIINLSEIKERENQIWPSKLPSEIGGINLNMEEQLVLMRKFKDYLPFNFAKDKQINQRYYFENMWFTFNDAAFLQLMLRHHKPERIIEIGSGFSSAVILDTNEQFFENKMSVTLIEPDPERLQQLLSEDDFKKNRFIKSKIQEVELKLFKELKSGDILFIDTSHITKTDSDLNHILFNILPVLEKGVFVHFHDIFYPFEYPKEWVLGRFNWNEIYLLRAFLMYNNTFEIYLFPNYIQKSLPEEINSLLSESRKDVQSLWLLKK